MTFVRRKIRLAVDGASVKGLSEEGLRISARISKAGGVTMGAADVLVYGLTLSTMNQLSTFGQAVSIIPRNTITIEAGDDVNGMSVVFKGTIVQAWPDFQGAPMIPFHIVAQSGLTDAAKPVDPISFAGATDVSTAMQKIQKQMDTVKVFENHGVNVKVDSPYLSGSPRNMAKDLANTAGIAWVIDDDTLAIWPAKGSRGSSGLFISPQTGMVSYPAFTQYGVLVRSEFRRAVRYGTTFTVQSDITPACGTWEIIRIEYDLESETPGGNWFMTLEGIRPGQGPAGPQ